MSKNTKFNKRSLHYHTFGIIVFLFLIHPVYAGIVDFEYNPFQDTFDSILNALIPVSFVLLFNISNEKSTKTTLLPIFDDILYNLIVWILPIVPTIVYSEFVPMIFTIVNATLHVAIFLFVLTFW